MPVSDSNTLPIEPTLPELMRRLVAARALVLTAPTGSGKTTRVPLALLDAPWLAGRRILMLEPRRLAARAAARYMASTLGEEVGATVGYRVRLDSRVSARTRIEVVTEGILTRRLQQDPELEGVGLIIFDEFHERSLQADLGLALCLDIQQELREDLRLLVMSATLEVEPLTALLGAESLQAQGQSFPVAVRHLAPVRDDDLVAGAVRGVLQALAEENGDLLLFLPGSGEIRRVESALAQRLDERGVLLCPLYGDLDAAAQDRAIRPDPQGRRRVVLATSIAETSLTIEGVRVVVDAGWSRLPRFDPNTGMSRLVTVRVSRAAAEQRRGRAGRLEPGVCYRLWPEYQALDAQTGAEILQADLAPLLLELALWGVDDPNVLRWLDPPPAGAVAQARELLESLEALDAGGRITGLGRRMAALPVHPRLGHMLLRGAAAGAADLAAELAAVLEERDFLRTGADGPAGRDVDLRLQALHGGCRPAQGDINLPACRRVAQVAKQLRRLLDAGKAVAGVKPSPGMLLALAFPDRVARRRGAGSAQYLLANGRGARLPADDALAARDWLTVGAMDAGERDGRVFLAAAFSLQELEALYPDRIETRHRVDWDAERKAVRTAVERCFGALVLERRAQAADDAAEVSRVLLQGIRREGLSCLPWRKTAESLRRRVQCLAEWDPDGGWPDLSDAALIDTLEEWLAPWLERAASIADLAALDLHAVLMQRVGWDRLALVDELAPLTVDVPSGAARPLVYVPGEPPVLAVKLQEMFGLRETPSVCRGAVPVLLHLLSPAQRPLQITRDLGGFWDRTYAEVRKEMKGRYPKHYWPEDPRSAIPTARVRPPEGKPK